MKSNALDGVVLQIRKKYGEGAIMKLGENQSLKVEVIPTGSISLDIALGGGIPRGRIIEIYGPEGAGKTTLCQHVVAEVQKRNGVAAFIDMEHAMEPLYAAACGVNINETYISQPDTGEQAMEIVETLIRSGAIDIVVVDSVAALVPRAEIDGEMGDSHPGLQARLMSQALRKLSSVVSQSNSILLFTNQLRDKIGVVYGQSETTPGGRALKFYASVRLDMRSIESIKQQGVVVGNRVRVRVTKNKVAPPFRTAEFDIIFGQGISKINDIVDVAVSAEIIKKRGSYYDLSDGVTIQGLEGVRKYLMEHPQVLDSMEKTIRKKMSEGAFAPFYQQKQYPDAFE